MTHLMKIIETNAWSSLRRDPPRFLGESNAIQEVETMVNEQLRIVSENLSTNETPDIDAA